MHTTPQFQRCGEMRRNSSESEAALPKQVVWMGSSRTCSPTRLQGKLQGHTIYRPPPVPGPAAIVPPRYANRAFWSAGFKICATTNNKSAGKGYATSQHPAERKATPPSPQWLAQTAATPTAAHTWKEHINVSSTLIIAPALSNSPQ